MAANPNHEPKEERAFPGSIRRPSRRQGFTLIELLVSTAIMVIVMLVLLQVIAGMTNIWHTSTGTISTFQSARAAFTTLTRTLSRATLKTYIDYVDTSGNPITNNNVNSPGYTPIASFTRASELTFLCGPTIQMIGGASFSTLITPTTNFPGDCVFFQAPLGITNSTGGATGAAADKFLQKSLNTVGFYVGFDQINTAGAVPNWLSTAMGWTASAVVTPRFRLMEYIEPTENVHVYGDTLVPPTVGSPPTWAVNGATYYSSISYIGFNICPGYNGPGPTGVAANIGQVNSTFISSVLAENVVLLIIRPRLEPPDEQTLAGAGGLINAATGVTYSAAAGTTTANSIISPNYNYDSRAWWGGAMRGTPPSIMLTNVVPRITNVAYARLMRNQLPPILDVAMVAVDPNSIVRLGNMNAALDGNGLLALPATCPLLPQANFTGTTPKKHLAYATQVNTAFPTPFSHSANMDVDLNNFGLWLSDNNIRYRIFRTSIQMEGAAWVNNY